MAYNFEDRNFNNYLENYNETDSLKVLLRDMKTNKTYKKEENEIKLREYKEIKERISVLKTLEETEEIKLKIKESADMLKSIKDELINHNSALVFSIAKKYQGRGLDIEDLYQEGIFGIMRAIDKFDVDLGYSFSTYATWWIRQTVTRSIEEHGSTIRIPIYMKERLIRIRAYLKQYMQEHEKMPTDLELMDYLKVTSEQLEIIKKANFQFEMIALDLAVGEEEDITLMNLLADEEIPQDKIIQNDTRTFLEKVLDDALKDPRSLYIIKNRMGFNEKEQPKTLEEIGEEFNITRERVRQIEAKTLRKIKTYCHRKKINLEDLR